MNIFATARQILNQAQTVGVTGRVVGVRGLTVSVADFTAPIGAGCRICQAGRPVEGRVVGFADEHTLVMPVGPITGICRGDRVVLWQAQQTLATGPAMLGRVLDAQGRPIDGLGPVVTTGRRPLWPEPISPMHRRRIDCVLPTGVKAIDAMLTIGKGQRMSILSGSGVGKSVLLGMIARASAADVAVIALIGERGREVRDFIERDLGPEGLKKSVVIVSTGDEPPLLRVQAGAVAAAIAEHFRDQQCDVVLLMDSLTRLATAQRQIGLAAGEPPTSRGYTPSVFNLLPQLLERSGRTAAGSITGFYTVLAEGDDVYEPLAEAVRAVTDGHICLSRELAVRGHYPAIDLLTSVSRIMSDLVDDEHRLAAREILRILALYREVDEMVTVGAYQAGVSREYDHAVGARPRIMAYLRQAIDKLETFDQTKKDLLRLVREISAMEKSAGYNNTPNKQPQGAVRI